MSDFKIFKEISIGGTTKERLIKKLIKHGVHFNEYAKILFEHHDFCHTNKSEKVKLIKITLSDLGMDNPCSFEEVIHRSSTLGLKLCPLYCAAFLRLEYLDQPEGPYLTVASDKPKSEGTYPTGFTLKLFYAGPGVWRTCLTKLSCPS